MSFTLHAYILSLVNMASFEEEKNKLNRKYYFTLPIPIETMDPITFGSLDSFSAFNSFQKLSFIHLETYTELSLISFLFRLTLF